MSVIKGKNREEVIKILKKLGDVVLIAKAEVLYAFKKPYFPTQTIEQIMEEIKKSPKGYKYYQVGDITITEISEVKEKTDGWKDCKECDLYGECDHQGAYIKKDGKWYYVDSGGEELVSAPMMVEMPKVKEASSDTNSKLPKDVFGTGSLSDQHEFEEKGKWVNKKKKKD